MIFRFWILDIYYHSCSVACAESLGQALVGLWQVKRVEKLVASFGGAAAGLRPADCTSPTIGEAKPAKGPGCWPGGGGVRLTRNCRNAPSQHHPARTYSPGWKRQRSSLPCGAHSSLRLLLCRAGFRGSKAASQDWDLASSDRQGVVHRTRSYDVRPLQFDSMARGQWSHRAIFLGSQV